MCVVCCWIQKSVENILSEFLFKICLQSIICLVQTSKTNQCFFQLLEEQISHWAVSSFSLVSGECAQQTWHMTHEPWAMATTWAKRLPKPTSRIKNRSIFQNQSTHSLRIMCIWGVIIYSAGICECWPTYQWTNASASVCNEAVLCYKTFPCSKYFLFYSITDIFDNKINNLALWYINFIAQHFSVRLRTSGMWAIAIVKNNNHKSMQHYCINFEVVQFFHSKCLRS